MSGEEDVELRDLVAQTLEANGTLAKIKAQLRASLFLALDEDVKVSQKQPLLNNKVKTYLDTTDGPVMFCIVREFLEFFNLHCTVSVYESESYLGSRYHYNGRQSILKELGIDDNGRVPILLQLINIAQSKSKSIEINLNLNGSNIKDDSHYESEVETMKTESNSSKTSQMGSSSNRSEDEISHKVEVKNSSLNNTFNINSPMSVHNQSNEKNKTFELSSPSVALKNAHLTSIIEVQSEKQSKSDVKSGGGIDSKENDDTYEDTSSIAEDSVTSNKVPENKLTNGSVDSTNEIVSHPVLKDSKPRDIVHDKLKISPQKSEKFKTKAGLSSLGDLPPLQLTKNRVNDILPSLYSKEFKEKSNLRELDKLFDMETEYEEDFMGSGELELTDGSDYKSKVNTSEEIENSNQNTDKSTSSKTSKSSKSIVKSHNKKLKTSNSTDKNNPSSTGNSISENLEFNSNVSD